MKHSLCLIALLLIACGKEAPAPAPKKAAVPPKQVVPEIKLPPVPQGKLPQMDPAKAKFIAVPSTPKDPEIKKVEEAAAKPAAETKKVEKSAAETKKAATPPVETKKAEAPPAEVKKAAPATEVKAAVPATTGQ